MQAFFHISKTKKEPLLAGAILTDGQDLLKGPEKPCEPLPTAIYFLFMRILSCTFHYFTSTIATFCLPGKAYAC